MIRLTKPQADVLSSLAVLSQGNQKWFQTILIVERRAGEREVTKAFSRATESLLEKLTVHVPGLVERRLGKAGYSWKLSVAGVAVAEQLRRNE